MARFTSKNTTVYIEDGAALSMVVGPGEGNSTVDNLQEDNSEAQPVYDRGVFDGFTEGDDQQQQFSISVQVKRESLTKADQNRILDAINKTGAWAAATTTDPSGTKWACRIRIAMSSGGASGQITLPCVRAIASFSEGKEFHTVQITGTNFQAPVRA